MQRQAPVTVDIKNKLLLLFALVHVSLIICFIISNNKSSGYFMSQISTYSVTEIK